ncbi:MAG: hypothetical protein A2V70_20405 [Planctomycetes bacterium RBG_13_63_9]|nr:MAG: hypothetical protein A2V70_20405 [Planctomycetes bacterium RBG_13_63_9]
MIGIDSMVLVYAGLVPRKSNEKSEDIKELSLRAKLLLHMKRRDTIVLPTTAMAEVLVPVPEEQRGRVVAILSNMFFVASFDKPSAVIAADLWARHKKLPPDLQYKRRHVLKSDAMIIATAKSAGASEFYTHDRNCRALASLVMTAPSLPENDPDDMFLRGDIERGEV